MARKKTKICMKQPYVVEIAFQGLVQAALFCHLPDVSPQLETYLDLYSHAVKNSSQLWF